MKDLVLTNEIKTRIENMPIYESHYSMSFLDVTRNFATNLVTCKDSILAYFMTNFHTGVSGNKHDTPEKLGENILLVINFPNRWAFDKIIENICIFINKVESLASINYDPRDYRYSEFTKVNNKLVVKVNPIWYMNPLTLGIYLMLIRAGGAAKPDYSVSRNLRAIANRKINYIESLEANGDYGSILPNIPGQVGSSLDLINLILFYGPINIFNVYLEKCTDMLSGRSVGAVNLSNSLSNRTFGLDKFKKMFKKEILEYKIKDISLDNSSNWNDGFIKDGLESHLRKVLKCILYQ